MTILPDDPLAVVRRWEAQLPWWRRALERVRMWCFRHYLFVRESLRDALLLLSRRPLFVRCCYFVNSPPCRKDACFAPSRFEVPLSCVDHHTDGEVETCRWHRTPHWWRGRAYDLPPHPEVPFEVDGGPP